MQRHAMWAVGFVALVASACSHDSDSLPDARIGPDGAVGEVDTVLDTVPADPSNDETPTFEFHATGGDATFECQLDAAAPEACSSPWAPTLGQGAHTATITAIASDGGAANPSPAEHTWTVDLTPPDDVVIDAGPPPVDSETMATFTFTGSEPGMTYTCSLDGAAAVACTSPFDVTVAPGDHTLVVIGYDAAGNATDPVEWEWTVHLPACGDGVIDTDDGETCDDMNADETDGCLASCIAATCGPGVSVFVFAADSVTPYLPCAVLGQVYVFDGAVDTSLVMPNLETIATAVTILSPTMTDVSLPALTSVTDFKAENATALTTLNLPALTTATGVVTITGTALTELALPALTTVTSGVTIAGHPGLTALDLDSLQSASTLYVNGVDVLPELHLPALQSVQAFGITSAPLLTVVDVPAFTSVVDLNLTNVPLLATLPLPPAATSLGFVFLSDTGITNLRLPGVTAIGTLYVINNAVMTSFVAADLAAVTGASGGIAIDGPALVTIDLPVLTTTNFGGLQVFGAPALTSFNAPVLAETAVFSMQNTSSLTSLSLPMLTTANGMRLQPGAAAPIAISIPNLGSTFTSGGLFVSGLPAGSTLDLGSLTSVGYHAELAGLPNAIIAPLVAQLTSVGGDLAVSGYGLPTLDLTAYTRLGAVKVGADVAVTVSLPAGDVITGPVQLYAPGGLLRGTGTTAIGGELNSHVPVDLPVLATVGGGVYVVDGLQTSYALPALQTVGGDLQIRANEALASVSLPALTAVAGAVYVVDNALLCSFVPASQITYFSYEFVPGASCP